jgi:predicted dehydrogenase
LQCENLADTPTGRKQPEHQGGFLLDGGVHFAAGLRLLLGALGEDVKYLAAFSALLQPELLPVDTIHSTVSTATGAAGTIILSNGIEFKSGLEIEIVTTNGIVNWNPSEVKVTRKGVEDESTKFSKDSGVAAEVAAFGKSLEAKEADPLQTPEEALADLRILQALLKSGEAGGALKVIADV